MSGPVSYHFDGVVSTIDMDDGKVNALSPVMLGALQAAFDQASSDGGVVVLGGRPGVFSAGFDLAVLRGGGPEAISMLQAGFRLAERMLSFPRPVVIACPGHAIAMASFLLLSADYRIGAEGPFKIVANEVAIGLTMPRAALEICRQRLNPAYASRVVILAESFSPADAVAAGFLDRVVEAGVLSEAAGEWARQLATLDMAAHESTKLRARADSLSALRQAMEEDDMDLTGGARGT